MKKEKKTNYVIRLEDSLRNKLQTLADKEGRSLASVIRQAILELLKRRKH